MLAGILPILFITSIILNDFGIEWGDRGFYLLVPWTVGLMLLGYIMKFEPVVEQEVAIV